MCVGRCNACVCVCVLGVSVKATGHYWSLVSVFLCLCSPHFLRQGLTELEVYLFGQTVLPMHFQGSDCLCLPSTRVVDVHHHS